jgi:hypothetical protein
METIIMPFDPDELANGMMKWLEHGRKPTPPPVAAIPMPGYPEDPEYMDPGVIYQNPREVPPAEMPGSGPSVAELQEQIRKLQEQLDGMGGDFEATNPIRRRPRPVEMDPGFGIPPDPNAPDRDPGFSFGPGYMDPPNGGYEYDIVRPRPDYMDPPKAFMYPNKHKHIGDLTPREMPNWRTLPDITEEGGPQEMPNYRAVFPVETIDGEPKQFEKPVYKYTEPMDAKPYTFLNEALDNRSPVEGLNQPVVRHGLNYTPSKVTPGKGASLN